MNGEKISTSNLIDSQPKIDVHDIFKRFTSSLVGGVPIVGSALNIGTGLLFDWLGGATDPWVDFENKINHLITNKLKDEEARFIRNSLSGLDKNLNDFLVDFNASVSQIDHDSKIQTFSARIGNISDSASRLLPHILKPTSHHATAPYIEHFFLLSIAIDTIGESLKTGTHNFSKRRYDLYTAIEKYVIFAMNAAGRERQEEISFKNFNTSSNKRIGNAVYDYSQNKKLSGTLFGWPGSVTRPFLQTIKSCGEIVLIIDLYKNTLKNIDTISKADLTSNYNHGEIPKIYTLTLSEKHKKFISQWNSNSIKNIINRDVMDASITSLSKTREIEFTSLDGNIPKSILSKHK